MFLIRALIILAAIAAFVAAPSVAHGKEKAPRKPSGARVHMCESVDVYTGRVAADAPHTRIAEACRDVAASAAQKAIVKCQAEGTAERCEVLFSADRKTLFIERKIVVSPEAAPEHAPEAAPASTSTVASHEVQ